MSFKARDQRLVNADAEHRERGHHATEKAEEALVDCFNLEGDGKRHVDEWDQWKSLRDVS